MLGLVGVTWIDTSVADFTVKVMLHEINPELALIVAVPAVLDVARPLEPAALPTETTEGSDEIQLTESVRSFLVLSV